MLTIHDMIPEIFPQYFQQDDFQIRAKKKLAPLASAIIAVSENTKRDIVRILNIPEEKIHVIYHGCSFLNKQVSAPLFNTPYLLYVGDRFGYKNFDLFLKYVEPILKRHQELIVVCTGKPFSEKELQIMGMFGVKERFIHHWVSSDEEFYSLYHYALSFVFPSAYEGFGLPILEAYQADCPVMLNQASCFPEIAGDAAAYFTMNQEESDFDEKFESLYTLTKEEREMFLLKQRERLKRYSWEKAATQLANIYQSITS